MDCSINALSQTLAERDLPTYHHGNRVERLSVDLGRRCGLGPVLLGQLALAARFHDIGKIGVPDRILRKQGLLDTAERAQIIEHSARGERIMRATARLDALPIALAVRHHHEAFDGSGYPDRLVGNAIPFKARLIRVVDSYDAMASVRSYQAPRSHAQIMEILREERERKHDPEVFDAFEGMIADHPLRVP